jgi:hypothetical protein
MSLFNGCSTTPEPPLPLLLAKDLTGLHESGVELRIVLLVEFDVLVEDDPRWLCEESVALSERCDQSSSGDLRRSSGHLAQIEARK